MRLGYDAVTVNCEKATKDAIINLSKFTKMPQRDVLKYLLMAYGVLPSDGAMNCFNTWNSTMVTKYRAFLIQKDESKFK